LDLDWLSKEGNETAICAGNVRQYFGVMCCVVQLICRLADHVGLPSKSDLDQFYGGRAHLPEHPWGEYYHRHCITHEVYDRQEVPWWSKGEQEFRAYLNDDEHERILYQEVQSLLPPISMLGLGKGPYSQDSVI
jgi:hypothetical protein